jgi:hypothetical protein
MLKPVTSKHSLMCIESHQVKVHLASTVIDSHAVVLMPLKRRKVHGINSFRQSRAPEIYASLDGQRLDNSDGAVAPKPRDVHLVKALH